MSFLIEDILSTKNSYDKDEKNETIVENRLDNREVTMRLENRIGNLNVEKNTVTNSSFSDQNSILHQTLVNRLNSPYYRGSESHHGSPFENFQHFCYDPAYLNYYRAFYERDYSTLQRQKSWPSYETSQANYLSYAMQYKYIYSPSKRKGGQVRFTANQTDILEKRFCSNKYLSPEERKVLAESLSLSDRQVKTWFQNRRAKWRRSNSNGEQSQESLTDEESNKKLDTK